MRAFRFVSNPLLDREVARGEWVAAAMRAKGDAGVREAKAVAPVGDPATDPTSGEFRDSIHVEEVETPAGIEIRIASNDPAAAYIEYGTHDTPAHGTLRRGAIAAAAAPVP